MSNIPTITFHPDYTEMQDSILKVRTAIAGSPFVKAKGEKLLPHPSSIDKTSPEAKMRYQAYIDGAEFDEFPAQTLRSVIGKLKLQDAQIELPQRLDYLVENCDNDGTSLVGAMESAASNAAQVKWHCIVADYRGLTGVDISEVSKADVAAFNPRANIKSYNRESVVWWNHERINDAMQLTFIMFRETALEFNQQTFLGTTVESFLILALDEDGNYYQQKLVKNSTGAGYAMGERDYVTVGNQPLKWLPVELVSDEEIAPGKLPKELGFIAPICDLALSRYRVSAEYKEAMRMIAPTVNINGTTGHDWDTFKEINGRDYVITGSGGVNILCGEMSMEVISSGLELKGYEQYFKDNESKVRALGGSFATDQGKDQTATEAMLTSSEQTSRLMTLAYQIESAFRRSVLYCGMFEGLWSPDAIEDNLDQVVIVLNKEFAQAKLSPMERDAIRNDYLSGIINLEEAIRQLDRGGALVADAEVLLNVNDGGDSNLTPED